MNEEIRRRIMALEQRINVAPVTLHFAEGSTRSIRGSAAHFRELTDAFNVRHSAAGEVVPELNTELEWLQDCVSVDEPAQLFGLLRAMLQGGMEPGTVNTD